MAVLAIMVYPGSLFFVLPCGASPSISFHPSFLVKYDAGLANRAGAMTLF
jgi:hypothetical protein